jgi:endonuclease/exonuclease/phosphatase family metal-dependent hydrolase
MHHWDRALSSSALLAVLMFILGGCSSAGSTSLVPSMSLPAYKMTPVATAAPAPATPGGVSATVAQTRAAAHSGAVAPALGDLRVMSFNCRVSTLFDLQNTWGIRKNLLATTIENFDPDLLGTQECLASQSNYLRERLGAYAFVGVGRNDGKRKGEMCGVYFKRDKFTELDSGHFWLSESPSKPGSKGWGAIFPRMVTWVKLQPKAGGQPFVWFNTHLDAFSSRARENGAKLLRQRIASIAGGLPVVVTGDFNADAGSTPYRVMLGAVADAAVRLTDTFRAMYPGAAKDDGTRHGFHGGHGGPRIDWILASNAFRTIDAGIDRTKGGLSYPSDHFAVTAILRPVIAPLVARVE